MIKITATHTMQDYLALLNTSTKIHVSRSRLTTAKKEAAWRVRDYANLTELQLRIDSCGQYRRAEPGDLMNFLIEDGVDERKFCIKGRKGLSFDQKRVVKPLMDRGIHTELLQAYTEMRSAASHSSMLQKLYSTPTACRKSADGSLVSIFDTHISERENLRVYYSDVAVVNFPKAYSDIVVPPGDEYILAWCDFPQADWRFAYNLYIKDDSNMEVMSKCDDAYEGLARLVEKDDFSLERFKNTRKEYKVNCLKVFYNSRSNEAIPKMMHKFYMSCPKYARMVETLRVLYRFHLPIRCDSYFGFSQLIPEGHYPDEFISKGINTTVQTFTSHVMIETVFGVLNKFWSLGYTPEDINVYYVRHDEPIFYLKRSVLKDAWVFGDCSDIHIDGFTPIKLDFHFGGAYKQEDTDITEEVNKCCESYAHLMTTYPDGTMHEYHPFPSVGHIYVNLFKFSDTDTHVRVYDYLEDTSIDYPEFTQDLNSNIYDVVAKWCSEHGDPEYIYVGFPGTHPEMRKLNGKTLMAGEYIYDSGVENIWIG